MTPIAARRPTSHSVVWHLALFGAALVVPTLILIVVLSWRSAEADQARIESDVRDVAESVVLALDRSLVAKRSLSAALATAPSVQAADYESFHRQASELARTEGIAFVLRDPQGRPLVDTRVRWGEALPDTVRDVDRQVIDMRQAGVSNLFVDATTGEPTFAVVVPVLRDGAVVALLDATTPSDRMVAVLRGGLPADFWAASFSDRNGLLVARTRDQAEWVGKPITEPLRRAALDASGNWIGPSHEGNPLVGGYARSAESGWLVAVGVDRGVLTAPLRRVMTTTLIVAGVLAALSAALAVVFGRRMTRPILALVDQAATLGRTGLVQPLHTAVGEVNAVSAALAEAAATLGERDRALRESEERLRLSAEHLQREVEERTREAQDAMARLFESQKMDSLGQLSSGIAHDFNNLLMATLGSLAMLKKRLPNDAKMHRLLDNAVHGAERGATLTQRLLAFARRQDLRPEPVDVPKLVQGMSELLARSLGPSVQIQLRFPESLPAAMVDANQLELAILNLATNARDAMPGGGRITIEAGAEHVADDVGDGRLAAGDYVVVRVRDEGTGMDEATLARAAEPFFTTKGVGKGTGLGLSMVEGLCSQSGGALRLSSRPGAGTSVEMWLRRAPPQAEDRRGGDRASERQELRPEPLTVLLVDDDALVAMGTAAMLEDLGHRVVEAASGKRALDILASGASVDVVITDHAMPQMTGVELAQRIRDVWPSMPIVLATGYVELPDGVDSGLPRLVKPFSERQLTDVLARVARGGRHEGKIVPFPGR